MIRHCADCKHVTKVASGQLRCGDERAHWVCDRFKWRDKRLAGLEVAYRELQALLDDESEVVVNAAKYALRVIDEVILNDC